MLHASVRAIGTIAGGPDQVHLALKDALTAEGTLIMYAGCPEFMDEIGRGHLTEAQEREPLEKLPAFTPTPHGRSARTGRWLSSCGRIQVRWSIRMSGDSSSQDGAPANSLRINPGTTPLAGRGSVLDRFAQLDGKILLVGCDHDNVTFLHYAEHIVDITGRRIVRFKVPLDENGTRVWKSCQEFDSSGRGAHPNWPNGLFARIVNTHLRQTGNAGDRIGDARAYLLPSGELLTLALEVMAALASEPPTGMALLDP